MNTLIQHIIEQLEDIQNGKLWIGSSFERKLKNIDSSSVF